MLKQRGMAMVCAALNMRDLPITYCTVGGVAAKRH